MDFELYKLIRLNEKRRQYLDGMLLNFDEFSVFDVVESTPQIIDATPVSSYSRNNERRRRST